MHRIFLMVIISLIPFAASSQDTLNVTDPSGFRQGRWKKIDAEGHLLYEGQFRDNLPVGTFRYFYPTGEIKTVLVYTDTSMTAAVTSYFRNSRKMAAGWYKDEKKEGLWQFYSEKDGSLASEENFRQGKKEGPSRVYYPDGTLAETSLWKEGLLNGPSEQFYTDGRLKLRVTYLQGEKHNEFFSWFPDGKVMISGRYYMGHPDGEWLYYNEAGKRIRMEKYDKGQLLESIEN